MPSYNVYLYNIPKVSEDGTKPIPVPGNESKTFEQMEEARKFADGSKDKFDRVMLMEAGDEGEKLIERYVDGQHERAEDIVRR